MQIYQAFLTMFLLASASGEANFTHQTGAGNKGVYQLSVLEGVIRNASGEPIAGVTLQNKSQNQTVVTDALGKFRIPAKKGDQLQISAIGYKTRNLVINQLDQAEFSLETSAAELEEAVVVAYGTQKKANLTGAVDQVSGKTLQNRPVNNIGQALQGVIGNLNVTTNTSGGAPNALPSINIRGYTGFGIAGAPLVVIDGVQGGDLNSINPADIESVSVIKDAAASAIYGSSAPYGVLLISTKKGSKGKAPVLTYNNNLNWASPINLPKMLNSLEFAEIYNDAFINAGRGPVYSEDAIARIKAYQAGQLGTETVQVPNTNAWDSWGNANANHDWFKIYFADNVFSQQHNLGVNGGTGGTTYYMGLGYLEKNGLYNFGDEKFRRFNLRANLSTAVNTWLTVNLRSSLSREKFNTPNTYSTRTGGNYMHQIARKWPSVALYNPDGNYSQQSDIMLHEEGGRNITTTDFALLTGELVFKLAKGWNLTSNYTLDGNYTDGSSHYKTLYHILPDGSSSVLSGTNPSSFNRSSVRSEHQIFNLFSSYEKSFGLHDFRLLGGYVRESWNYQSFGAGNQQLYSDNIPSLSLTYSTAPSVTDLIRKLGSEGIFGRFNYSYDDKYLLELTGRYDGSSRFLSDVRWKFYPGISAGWVLSKESFWKPIDQYINSFKLRASYGSLGDQSFLQNNYYPFYPNLVTIAPRSTAWLFGGSQQAAVSQPSLINPNLTWITTSTLNFGVDASFLNNRLSGSFEWFIRKSEDFAGPSQAVPAVLGTTPPTTNNAAMETRGFELTLKWADQIGDFGYGIRGVLSDYRGKVTRYPNPNKLLSTWYEGLSMGEIWGYTSEGLFSTNEDASKAPNQKRIYGGNWGAGDVQYRDLNGDEVIDFGNNTVDSSGDRRIIGNNTPRYAFGLNLEANWKGFDVQVFVQGIAKRDAWIGSNYFWGVVDSEWQGSPFTVHKDRWTPANPNGYFPKFYMSGEVNKNQQTQTRYLQNAAYLRLKNLQLGYSIPAAITDRVKISKARLYVSVDNLFTITKLQKTMDPELSISDGKIYPLQRTISTGINLTF
ncbi:TonB-dependent receptor [Flavihumibacter sp. CACIAM 22H1]|uniref:SusC/RagA family TonB-linked outer membrane protein n=1 Tax=Flavihumibacter sp. CACIAM 22H1 TaxID=1812911 RepID=UPI0007A7EEAF|nr:TonB-dependent receptor [Flavihumibacter sp. CACIAM 22H1]KYP14048.1 MAG: hypothetical protein A1D16_08855 [Flavihumibacter sp. CACIAM 22H1]